MNANRKNIVLAYMFTAALFFAVHAGIVDASWPHLQEQKLTEGDGYTRFNRVTELHQTGDWYDRTIERANWPDGEIDHHTRPFDLILLAGASALRPFFEFDDALFWWGAFSAPVFHLILGFAIAWVAASFLGAWRGPVAMLLLLTQAGVLGYSQVGKADHHPFLMIVFVLTVGLTVRILRRRFNAGASVTAGAVVGFGLLLSTEFLLILAAVLGALFLSWIRRGGDRARTGLYHAIGLTGAVSVGLIAEYRPSELLSPHYDRMSIVHLVVAGLVLGVWLLIAWAERRLGNSTSTKSRLQLALMAAGTALAAMATVFPAFFLGPVPDMPLEARLLLVDSIGEVGSLIPTDLAGLLKLLLHLGFGLIAIPILVYLIVKEKRAPNHDAWIFFGIATGLYTLVSLWMTRFAVYPEILFLIPMAEFLVRRAEALQERPLRWQPVSVVAGLSIIIVLSITGNAYIMSRDYAWWAVIRPCQANLKELSAYLEQSADEDNSIYTIAARPDLGSEIIYRTRHRVISTASFTNPDGAVVMQRIYSAIDDDQARAVISARGIDHLLTCPASGYHTGDSTDMRLYPRLMRGSAPDWLQKVTLSTRLEEIYDLYRIASN